LSKSGGGGFLLQNQKAGLGPKFGWTRKKTWEFQNASFIKLLAGKDRKGKMGGASLKGGAQDEREKGVRAPENLIKL